MNYHYLYKSSYEREDRFLFFILQMEFSVIETLILIMEGRFSLVLISQILQAEQNN